MLSNLTPTPNECLCDCGRDGERAERVLAMKNGQESVRERGKGVYIPPPKILTVRALFCENRSFRKISEPPKFENPRDTEKRKP
jgi:hypothetical protein